MLLPSLSSMPDFMVAARMLLSSSWVKTASNCWAACLTAALGSLAAALRRVSSERASVARPEGLSKGSGRAIIAMSNHLDFRVERACGLDGLQNSEQVLRCRAEGIQGLHDVGELGSLGQL